METKAKSMLMLTLSLPITLPMFVIGSICGILCFGFVLGFNIYLHLIDALDEFEKKV